MKEIVGTCGNCGGPVTVPVVWHGINPPRPTCDQCGAHPVQSFGPVLPMAPKHDQPLFPKANK